MFYFQKLFKFHSLHVNEFNGVSFKSSFGLKRLEKGVLKTQKKHVLHFNSFPMLFILFFFLMNMRLFCINNASFVLFSC